MARLTLPLSALGFGAFKIGRNQGIKYAGGYPLPNETEVSRLLNGVLDLGINYIDTAPAYGSSEERIGLALAHRRDEFYVSTKVGEVFDHGVSSYDFSADAVRDSIGRSLKRLRRDVLDLVFVHSSRDDLRVLTETDVVPTLLALREEGSVRAIGLSGYTAGGCQAALPWANALMLRYHEDDRTLEPVIAQAAHQGIAVIIKQGLASGRCPPDQAIPFVLRNPKVMSLVIGTLSLAHLAENVAIAAGVRRKQVSDSRQSVAREDVT